MSTVLARVTVTASANKAPVANKTATKTVAPQQRASIGARAVAFAKTNVPAAVALVNAVAASPAHAEAGKLFDFDLTLPIIATEFLLLMTILDKTVFGPVGKALDDRDELIRSQLAAVGDNSSEVESLIVSIWMNLFFLVSFSASPAAVASTRRRRRRPARRPAREIPDAMRLGFGLSARGFGCFDFVFFFLYTVYPYRCFENRRNGSTDDLNARASRMSHPS